MISISTKEKENIQHIAGESHRVVKNNIKAIVKHFNLSGMNIESHTFKSQDSFKRMPILGKVFKSSVIV